MAQARITILGDSKSYQRAVKEAAVVTDKLSGDMKKLAVSAKASANAQVAASVHKTARLKNEIAAYRAIAAASQKGSREEVAATNLAIDAQRRLARSLGVTQAESRRLSRGLSGAGRDAGRFGRGVLAGSGALGHFGRAAIFASNSVLGGVGFAFALKSLIGSAATMQEETEKTGVVFGQSAKDVQQWAGTLATSFGVGEGAALRAAGTFGNMFRSLSFGEQPAAQMSKRLVELAADMASFNNASPADTLEALQSGLAGQVRPLRQFGVFLSDARLRQEALRLGIYKGKGILSASQKVLASYNLILKDTKLQQGDVARNTGSLSVAQSKLTASLQDSEAIIGRALLPTLASLANEAAIYLDRLNKTGRLQRDVNSAVKTTKDLFGGLKELVSPVVGAFRLLGKATGGTENEVKLLGTAFVILEARAKLIKWGLIRTGIQGVGTEAVIASGEVATLRTRLLGLSKLGPIAVTIALSVVPKNKKGQEALDKAGIGFLGRLPIIGPAEQQVAAAGQRTHDFLFGAPKPATSPVKPTSAARAALRQTFEQAKLLNPELTRKAFDLGQAVARAFLSGADKPVTGTGKSKLPKALSLAGQFNLAELRLAQASLTAISSDDRAILVTEEAIVKQQIEHTKKLKDRTALTQKLASILEQIRGIDKASADAEKQAAADRKQRLKDAAETALRRRNARQFGALGLGPTGDALVPNRKSLQKDLGKLSDAVAGTFLDTSKTQTLLGRIRKVLAGGLGALSQDVRSKVKDLLDGVDQELKNHSGDHLTKFRVINTDAFIRSLGLNLNPEQVKAARGKLSQLGAGGVVPRSAAGLVAPAGGTSIHLYGAQFHGVQNVAGLKDALEKHTAQRSGTRRGRNAGR